MINDEQYCKLYRAYSMLSTELVPTIWQTIVGRLTTCSNLRFSCVLQKTAISTDILATTYSSTSLRGLFMKIEYYCYALILFSSITVRNRPSKSSVQLTEQEVRGLCLKSREIFLSQPILLELEAPLKICGKNWYCTYLKLLSCNAKYCI